ncbi:MAG: response regulator, partial [Treponema sp.]|nr:response regulator [Treponema sp.]
AETILKKEHEIIKAQSGKEAIALLLKAPPPDLVLLDIMMPDMNGWETFTRLKAISLLTNIPIVFLTSINEKSEIDRAYKMGAADFIIKPFEAEDLLERTRKMLTKK